MSLFKKKEKPMCACQSGCPVSGNTATKNNACCTEAKDGICCIKVLGAGCASCHKMYENAKEAVKNTGLNIEIEYITDMQKVMEYGVISLPAIVVNDKVISMGKVLKTVEIEKLISMCNV